jgi:hypothetical protein
MPILWAIVAWLTRSVFLTFIVAGCTYAFFALLMPVIVHYASSYFSLSGLTTLMAGIPDSIYWGYYLFRFDLGLPAVLSAFATRFIVRRVR